MVQFEELQQLWQSQRQPEMAVVDSRGMTHALRRFGRRQNYINAAKVALVAWQTWFCLSRLGLSVLTVVGQAIFLAGVIHMLTTDWRNQLGIARLDFTKPSVGFVDSVLDRLRDPNAPFRRRFWLHAILIGGGANLLLAARWAASTPQHRIVAHFTAMVAPIAAYALGLQIRSKRYALEYRPLMQRLTAMKKALEEQWQ
jgi:hypothetical protein